MAKGHSHVPFPRERPCWGAPVCRAGLLRHFDGRAGREHVFAQCNDLLTMIVNMRGELLGLVAFGRGQKWEAWRTITFPHNNIRLRSGAAATAIMEIANEVASMTRLQASIKELA